MWIDFQTTDEFAVKMYVGGVNAVSAELAVDPTEANLEGHTRRVTGRSTQDYIVTPTQRRLDGIATEDGTVRQFVAMPMGSGYTIEGQISGQEVIGGLQFEVTPLVRAVRHEIFVQPLTGKRMSLLVRLGMTVREVKSIIEERERIPSTQFRLHFHRNVLDDSKRVSSVFSTDRYLQLLTKASDKTLRDCSVQPVSSKILGPLKALLISPVGRYAAYGPQS